MGLISVRFTKSILVLFLLCISADSLVCMEKGPSWEEATGVAYEGTQEDRAFVDIGPSKSGVSRGERLARHARASRNYTARHGKIDSFSGRERSAQSVIQGFCSDPRVKKYLEFTPDWSTISTSLKTLGRLKEAIRRDHSFRKICIKQLEKAYGKGYIDDYVLKYQLSLDKRIRLSESTAIEALELSTQLKSECLRLEGQVEDYERSLEEEIALREALDERYRERELALTKEFDEESVRLRSDFERTSREELERIREESYEWHSKEVERIRRNEIVASAVTEVITPLAVDIVDSFFDRRNPFEKCLNPVSLGERERKALFAKRMREVEEPLEHVKEEFVSHYEEASYGEERSFAVALDSEKIAQSITVADRRVERFNKVVTKNKYAFRDFTDEACKYARVHRLAIKKSLGFAKALNDFGEMNSASFMTHFAEHMVEVGEKTICAFAWVGRGGFRSMQKISKTLGSVIHETFTDPIALLESAGESLKAAGVFLGKVFLHVVTDPGQFIENAETIIGNFGKAFLELPTEEKITQTSEFVFDIIFGGRLAQSTIAISSQGIGFLKQLRPILNSSQRIGGEITRKLSGIIARSPSLLNLTNPLYYCSRKALKGVRKAIKFASKIIRRKFRVRDEEIFRKFTKISHEARLNKGNFTFSEIVSLEECENFAKGWLGKGYRMTTDGSGLKSVIKTQDYIIKKCYRFPKLKQGRHMHAGRSVANFEEYIQGRSGSRKVNVRNGHLIILD